LVFAPFLSSQPSLTEEYTHVSLGYVSPIPPPPLSLLRPIDLGLSRHREQCGDSRDGSSGVGACSMGATCSIGGKRRAVLRLRRIRRDSRRRSGRRQQLRSGRWCRSGCLESTIVVHFSSSCLLLLVIIVVHHPLVFLLLLLFPLNVLFFNRQQHRCHHHPLCHWHRRCRRRCCR
jgi:hypothetical protein